MLGDDLARFFNAYDDLCCSIKEFDPLELSLSEDDILMLSKLVLLRVRHLKAFEILLKQSPETALDILKDRYLSQDLSNHVKDQVSDLEIMFSDILEILGDEKFQEVLDCPEFLSKNKRNRRVTEAIAFALNED